MRLYRLFSLLIIIFCATDLYSQNYPLYSGYFLNPYIYNPAAASTSKLQVNAGYRRQWFGINGAPSIATLTASSLINDSRAGWGIKISSFSRGFLNSTDASAAYSYGVPLNKTTKLFFGLSAGVLTNMVNLKSITSNASDQALQSASNSIIPGGSFGMLLKSSTSGLDFGFVLPKMIGLENLDSKFAITPVDNIIVTASFSKWNPSPKVVKKGKGKVVKKGKKTVSVPLELFSLYRYSVNGGLFEGTAKYNFNPSVWLSASYRQNSGIIPGLGIVTPNVSFSYFYEMGVGGDLPLKTHDVVLSLHLGKDKKFRERKPPVSAKKITPPPSKITTQPNKNVTKVPEKKVEEKKVEEKKQVEPVKKDPVIVDTQAKADSIAQHRPRFKTKLDLLDSAAVNKAHEEERKQLDQHIEDHKEAHDEDHNHPVNERHDFVKRGAHHEELELGTYVIAGAFQSRANAEHYSKTLKDLGYESDFGHLSVRNLWYVFIAEEKEVDQAKKERNRLQKNKIFKEVWLLTVQE